MWNRDKYTRCRVSVVIRFDRSKLRFKPTGADQQDRHGRVHIQDEIGSSFIAIGIFYVIVEYVVGTVIFDTFRSNFPLHYFKCRVIGRISTPVQFKVDPVRIYRSADPNRTENWKSRFDTSRISVLDRPMYISALTVCQIWHYWWSNG